MMEEFFELRNGVRIPKIGFGTYKTHEGADTAEVVHEAIECGYRLFDTATLYKNEKEVGEGIRKTAVGRNDLFVTTKLANEDRGYVRTLKAFNRSLDDLGLDYIDLYLIHWPASAAKIPDWKRINAETWRAMEDILMSDRVRAIGVSNFMTEHLDALAETARVLPMVNQIEYHPGWKQPEVVGWCRAHDVVVEAWSPLGRTRIFSNSLLNGIAEKYGKTVAQICLRWEIQNGIIPIPKSTHIERMRQNLDIFDFELSKEEMNAIDNMPSTGQSGLTPDTITF